MDASIRRTLLACLSSGLLLVLESACKRPETAVRERPVQRVELVQDVQGMTPLEEKALVAQLAEGFGLPPEAPDSAEAPIRVFRLTLKGRPNPDTERGLGKTWLITTGQGLLMGVLAPGAPLALWSTWESAAIGAGAGALVGFGYGPVRYQRNQALMAEMGYLPWVFTAEWEVLERGPGAVQTSIASSQRAWPFGLGGPTTHLDLRPHLRPLPPGSRGEAEVRQASLRAYADALTKRFRPKG